MTKISAMVVADSINQQGDRITTMMITFPRFILAELNTHRMLSKNSASSRAIPFQTMVQAVKDNPFIPIAWQKDHKGMQGVEYITDENEIKNCISDWLECRDWALNGAEGMSELNSVTKQLCNRLLEPFMWHTVLCTATEWENFFALRCPQYEYSVAKFRSKKDLAKTTVHAENFTDLDWLKLNKGQSEIHMMALAEAMWDARNESTPKVLQPGEWHIPFEDKLDSDKILKCMKLLPKVVIEKATKEVVQKLIYERYNLLYIKVSTAMAARTSYTVVGDEKEFGYEKQIELHDRMANQVPFHASPFEHCARAMTDEEYNSFQKGRAFATQFDEFSQVDYTQPKQNLGWCRNYKGFIQYREILEDGRH